MFVEQMAYRVQVFMNFLQVGMQSPFRNHLHIGKPYAAAQFTDHEINSLKTIQVPVTLQPFKMLMQLNNRKLNGTRKIGIKDNLVQDIPRFKSGTIILQVKLVPGNGQQKVFPGGGIGSFFQVVRQIAEFDIQDIGRLNCPLEVSPDIHKANTLSPGHGDLGGTIIQEALPDQPIEHGNAFATPDPKDMKGMVCLAAG